MTRIKTFSEEAIPTNLVEQVTAAINKSKAVVILGFGFHRPNMKLLLATEGEREVFAGVHGVYSHSVGVVREMLQNHFRSTPVKAHHGVATVMLNDLGLEIRMAIGD